MTTRFVNNASTTAITKTVQGLATQQFQANADYRRRVTDARKNAIANGEDPEAAAAAVTPAVNVLRQHSSAPYEVWLQISDMVAGVVHDDASIYKMLTQDYGLVDTAVHPGKTAIQYQIRTNTGEPVWQMNPDANIKKGQPVHDIGYVNFPWVLTGWDLNVQQALMGMSQGFDFDMDWGEDALKNTILAVANAIIDGVDIPDQVNGNPAPIYGFRNHPNRETVNISSDIAAFNGTRDESSGATNGEIIMKHVLAAYQKLVDNNLSKLGPIVFLYPKAWVTSLSRPYNREAMGKSVLQYLMDLALTQSVDGMEVRKEIRFVQCDQLPDDEGVMFVANKKVIEMKDAFPIQPVEVQSNFFSAESAMVGKVVPVIKKLGDATSTDASKRITGIVHLR